MDDAARFSKSHGATPDGGQDVIVGKGFAFVAGGLKLPDGLGWLTRMIGATMPKGPQIISLFGNETIGISGLDIKPTKPDVLKLTSITSDKSLYRSESDPVNLLVLNPLAANCDATLNVNFSGLEYSRHKFTFGTAGEKHIILSKLPVGEFEVFLEDCPDEVCEFSVAEYKLVPLVASMTECVKTPNDGLRAVLKLTSFGVPVSGPVNIDVLDKHFRLTTLKGEAKDGLLEVEFHISGAGPHSLQLQLADEPGKTASLPIRGSREEERSRTVFSPLGTEVFGSLISEAGTREVRGIYLGGNEIRTTPISLEQVDTNSARLKLNTAVSAIRIVALDPTYPAAKVSVAETMKSAHPEHYDPEYKKATELFKEGRYELAAATFEDARGRQRYTPHPYYAYWTACCYARDGQLEKAIVSLRQAIEDGWHDRDHMLADEDLANLHGYEPYERLALGGTRELYFTDLPAGHEITVDGFTPVTLLAIGAIIENKPWEGWASIVPPSTVTTTINMPDKCVPGEEITIEVITDSKRATAVFAVLKDARLLSADTPATRMAIGIKSYVESGSSVLTVGHASRTVKEISASLVPETPGSAGSIRSIGSFGSWGGGVGSIAFGSAGSGWGSPIQERSAQSSPPPAGAGGIPPIVDSIAQSAMAFFSAPEPAGNAPMFSALTRGAAADVSEGDISDYLNTAAAALAGSPESAGASKQTAQGVATRPSASKGDVPLPTRDPEVLFAGLLEVEDGRAQLKITLPDTFADYILECFTLCGYDWNLEERRFVAVKDPFVYLTVPVFARADEQVRGTLHIGSTKEKVQAKLLRDGVEVQLYKDDKPYSATQLISGATVAVQFAAAPGDYQAVLMSEDGNILSRQARIVQEPGKLKRRLRTLRLLESGQSIALADDSSIVSLKLMPSIDEPFDLLIDATANYGHACAEQTSVILLSACAMFLFSGSGCGGSGGKKGSGRGGNESSGGNGGSDDRRTRAESIIIAGVKREKSMWLPGRGFKAYPEWDNKPDEYLSQKASTNLWGLKMVKDAAGPDISQALSEAIDLGLQMADDVTKALKLSWPPAHIHSCSDAYHAIRFSTNGGADKGLDYLVRFQPEKPDLEARALQYLGGIVSLRMETAYAAAGLLRAGGAQHLKRALELTNKVISQFNEEGRLYSTCDSVAAIALMSELKNRNITGGTGKVEVDGKVYALQDALKHADIKSIKVTEGCATASVDREILEDWSKFQSNVQVKIGLQKDGKASGAIYAGDTMTLTVTLEEGYKDGDLLWVCLPDALSRVVGGGQVKLFSLDFKGAKELKVPLAATGTTIGFDGKPQQQQLAVCVRNMFQEERVACPGMLPVSIGQKQ